MCEFVNVGEVLENVCVCESGVSGWRSMSVCGYVDGVCGCICVSEFMCMCVHVYVGSIYMYVNIHIVR